MRAFLELEFNYKCNGKELSLCEKVFQFFFHTKDVGNTFQLLTKIFQFCQINDSNHWRSISTNIHWWQNPSSFLKFGEIYPLLSSPKSVFTLAQKTNSNKIYACYVFPLWRSLSTYMWRNISTFLCIKLSILGQ